MSINPEACLPPGFRFHPTDEELIVHYLRNRGTSVPCPASIIVEVDIYKFNPWELPEKALFGEREWYFFSPRDRKYPNGSRPNRAAGSGYWKATGTDKPIFMAGGNVSIGVKKALVFYKGRPPKGEKTNWIMHEYRLSEALTVSVTSSRTIKFNDSSMRLEDWVLCRIYKKHNHLPHITVCEQKEKASSSEESALQGYSNEINQSAVRIHKSPSVSELLDKADNYMLSHLLSEDINDNNTAASTTTSKIEQVMNYASYNNKKNVLSLDDQDFSQTGLTFSVMENPIKRQRIMENFLGNLKSSKELYSSTNLTTFIDQINTSRYNSLYPRHSNPHSELSSNFQFH